MSAETVLHRLIERGWLDAARVVAGDATVRVRRRRHTTFEIRQGGGGCFVKQLRQADPEVRAGLSREAAFLAAASRVDGLRGLVPRLIGGVPEEGWLVTERLDGRALVDGAEDHPCTPGFAAATGAALAALHATPLPQLPGPPITGVPRSFFLPRHLLAHPEDPGAALAGILRRWDALPAFVEAQAAAWRPTGTIHADLKWDNVFVRRDGRPALVDWELVRSGDAAWDAAWFMQSGLARVLLRRGGADPVTVADAATGMGARRAFFAAWTAGRPHTPDAGLRVMAFAAVRWVHAAYAHLLHAGRPLPVHTAMVATAWHWLSTPERGVALLGVGR